ncbi:recombination protein RecR [Candidatus Peribacteria bacterium]|nr:recombination protein RecR [Candidatus Peribacteria bacterium]
MTSLPPAVTAVIDALSALPGIGQRSAERLTLRLLQTGDSLALTLSQALQDMTTQVHECQRCHHLCEGTLCSLCSDPGRDQHQLCVVESPLDVLALERTHSYRGGYHVLHGTLSPLRKVSPQDIRLASLLERLREGEITELILATGASTESEATALYLLQEAEGIYTGSVTRLSRGIPSGMQLDSLDVGTVTRAMTERRSW